MSTRYDIYCYWLHQKLTFPEWLLLFTRVAIGALIAASGAFVFLQASNAQTVLPAFTCARLFEHSIVKWKQIIVKAAFAMGKLRKQGKMPALCCEQCCILCPVQTAKHSERQRKRLMEGGREGCQLPVTAPSRSFETCSSRFFFLIAGLAWTSATHTHKLTLKTWGWYSELPKSETNPSTISIHI